MLLIMLKALNLGSPDSYRDRERALKALQQCVRSFVLKLISLLVLCFILHSALLNQFYIGFTSNLEQRLVLHLNPTENRKFTAKIGQFILKLNVKQNSSLSNRETYQNMKSKVYIENLPLT
jgi:putative endonuclease